MESGVSVPSYKTVRTWSIVTGCRIPYGAERFSVTIKRYIRIVSAKDSIPSQADNQVNPPSFS